MTNALSPWGQETKYFHLLSPDHVMHAAETWGERLSGRVLTLNSLENRVYEVELANNKDFGKGFSSRHVILKFYRPGRWTQSQITEEHKFLQNLIEFEVPVAAPIEFDGQTLHRHQETNLWYAIFPKVQGRLKDELIKEEIDQIGRLIGRIHNIGQIHHFKNRVTLNTENFVDANKLILESIDTIHHLSFSHYLNLLVQASNILKPIFSLSDHQRLHGDFHRGNIVWTDAGPVAVDFDDCLMGPVEQDLWLLFPGKDQYSQSDRERFLSSYKEMTRKEFLKLNLTEGLRTMRMIHFNAWIAKRWEDHSFQRVFPQFTSANYWDQELIDLRIQISHLQEIGIGIE
jgi:Ser/Thr protein kinase RdoA (MazF antagonist)